MGAHLPSRRTFPGAARVLQRAPPGGRAWGRRRRPEAREGDAALRCARGILRWGRRMQGGMQLGPVSGTLGVVGATRWGARHMHGTLPEACMCHQPHAFWHVCGAHVSAVKLRPRPVIIVVVIVQLTRVVIARPQRLVTAQPPALARPAAAMPTAAAPAAAAQPTEAPGCAAVARTDAGRDRAGTARDRP